MNTTAIKQFRKRLASDQPALGLWITLESPSIAEMAVAAGLDWIVIDAEHGHLDWKEITEHVRAAVRSNTVALVRVAELNGGLIKRALDIGADGVVIPWVESEEQLKQAVRFANYPPRGVRGIGAERATAWGQCLAEHAAEANDNVLVIPIVETVTGGKNLQALCKVDGVDVVFFGPADYSASSGHTGQWEGPGVAEELLKLAEHARRLGKHCGVMATDDENLGRRIGQGFRMLGVGTDSGMLLRSLGASLRSRGRQCKIAADLSVATGPAANRLARPPESIRPERRETMNAIGNSPQIELAAGVVFECLVGAHNQTRGLTTGFATFAPGASLAYHTHPCSESITLVRGRAVVCVEGRNYTVSPFDNVTVPRGLAHSVANLSASEPAVFHVALASENPARDWVERKFSEFPMPDTSEGAPPFERVTRFAHAKRFEAGPSTEFIDYFNDELMPGMEMSGGYGRFRPGGRLPAHFHDFDESICITEGTATCVVEGRRYSPSNGGTAMVPRGRVHYFINESSDFMSMVWVYAGPMPERIIVDEACATVEGDPWRV